MTLVIYIVSALFILLWATMLGAYFLTRHIGLFLFAFVYGLAGLMALMLTHWWPLLLGLVVAWVMRLAGMEPNTSKSPPEKT
ncbi:MAG: hypothetical protein WED00_07760 [Aquisalimonadaceae bacterium]